MNYRNNILISAQNIFIELKRLIYERKEIIMRLKIICASVILSMFFGTAASAVVAADLNLGGGALHTDADVRVPPLSHGVNIIRGKFELKKSALSNSDVAFSPEEFEQILGVRKIKGITVTRLPDFREGVLTLGGNEILAGQTIARENIRYIRLVPHPDRLGNIRFYFKDAESPDEYSILCTVNILEALNFAPTAHPVNISTQRNIPVFKAMKGSDPESDALNYSIVETPKKGLLEMRGDGVFVYKPGVNFTGKDKFVYRVQDEHGNWSNSAAVEIRVTKAASDIRFTDMDNHWAANSAVKGVAAGFIDADLKFEPHRLMTRAEFVQMALRAAKLDKNLPEDARTGFADDGDIPAVYRAYIKQARDSGIVNGIPRGTGVYFDPNGIITRAEAAVILNNILKIPVLSMATSKPAFSDAVMIPVWAERDIAALNTHGILNGDHKGNFNPYGLLNRAQSAEMLCNMLEYTESVRKSKSFWARLFG